MAVTWRGPVQLYRPDRTQRLQALELQARLQQSHVLRGDDYNLTHHQLRDAAWHTSSAIAFPGQKLDRSVPIFSMRQFTPGYLEGSSGNTEQKWRPNSYHERFDFIDDQVRQLLQLLRNEKEKEQESLLLLEKAANNLEAVQKVLRCTENDSVEDEITTLKERLSSLANDVAALRSSVESGRRLTGSVFTRWGNSTCPPTSERVYWGYAGGPLWTHTGSGSNLLCLPSNPVYDDLQRTSCGPSTVYGVEYHVCPDPKHFSDAVCAVCRSEHATTIMIPATNVCPPTWTKEYTGHVMAGYGDYKASSDYVCIDDSMEVRAGGGQGLDSQLLYYTISKCGSLPCPPYQNEKILTCVVCSK